MGLEPFKSSVSFFVANGSIGRCWAQKFSESLRHNKECCTKTILEFEPTLEDFVAWNCTTALERIGFGTESEIARFWNGVSVAEARLWCQEKGRNSLKRIEIEDAEGNWRKVYARVDIAELLRMLPDPPKRVRFLSPFDPLIRDRKRTQRLFGFDFKIEIFIPEKRREFGYYVCPILEGSRLIGRIELGDRPATNVVAAGVS